MFVFQGWFCEVQLWGGKNSAVNAIPSVVTAFVHRDSMLNIQFIAASMLPPFPEEGLSFVDGNFTLMA
jgi:hypothetical protein